MKKFYCVIIFLLLLSPLSFGDVIGDTESMTPSDVNIFAKTRHIGRLLKTANYIIYNILDEEQRNGIIGDKNTFLDKTGIDYLDENSLKNFGIDTSKQVSFAIFEKDNQRDVMLIFLPVKDEKEFTLKFTEVLKKSSDEKEGNVISPVKAKYKNIIVTKLQDDMYVTGLGGYFIIGSTDDIVRKVIDVREARSGSLVLTDEYKDYISRDKNNYDINAFISRKFLEQFNSSSRGEGYGSAENRDVILTQGGEANARDIDTNNLIKAIDYISAGIGFDGNKFQVNGAVKLSSDNPYVEMILGLLKTGENGRALFVRNADSTVFLSLNYKYLDNLCGSGIPICMQYNQMKADLKKDIGVDFEKDIIPYYTGVMNVISIDSGTSGGMGDIVVFLPFNDEKKVEDVWRKFRSASQAKYSKTKKFGEEKINGKKTFWYIDETQMRFFVAYDTRGIYAGNSTGLIKAALKSDSMDKAKDTGRLATILNDKTFFLVNIRKNNFIKSMLQMRAQGTPGLGAGLSHIGEVNVFCEKKDKMVSIDFDVEIKNGAVKGK